MMETTQRGKKKVNKRNNVDKFNENIGLIKNMKDKIKPEKPAPLQGVEGVKSEPNLDIEFKKEPVLSAPLCDNEPKNSNICSKTGDTKSMKSGLMESVNVAKMQDRPFIDPKAEIGSRPEDASEEEDLQSNLLPTKIKAESMASDGNLFAPDSNENLILGLCNQNPNSSANTGTGLEQTGSGIQPLPSNVINKQPGTMEAQYMQQQSQIFVFTTALANKSAESVLQGQYPSIIAYHCAQPGTKKYLEKHPLKLNQFNRQSPAQWLNNLAQIKQKTIFGGNAHMKGMAQMPMGPRGPISGNMAGPCEMPQGSGSVPGPGPGSGPGPGPGPGPRPLPPNMQSPMTEIESINEQSEIPPANREVGDHRHGDFPGGGVSPMNSMNVWNQGYMNQNNLGYSGPMKNIDREKPCVINRSPMVDNMNPNHFAGVSQLTLTGTKVPTENLTPQQRQHRAEQLATLRKMQEMLFPENQTQHTDEFGNPKMVPGGTVPTNPDDPNRNSALDTNEVKNQIAMKSVNNTAISSGGNNNSNSNNINNNNSNNNNNNNNSNNKSNNNSSSGSSNNNSSSNNPNNPSNSNNNNSNSNHSSGNSSSNNTGNNNNSNNNSSNNNNSNNNNNNNNSSSNNSNNNNGGSNSSTSSNSNSNSPMNRLMGRNMNGQSNRNMPMDNPMNHNMVNPPSNALDTPENIDPMQDQSSHMLQKMAGGNTFPSVAAQLEWQKHYQQFQEEQKKKKGSRTDSPVSRSCSKMQGPPPPYHQTARSASVPIAVPSPNPGSPSNTTSNLSLPSPRTSSDLNSPSEINKHASTPGSGVKMSSPPNNQGSPSCSKLISNNPETPVSSASQSPTSSSRKESSQPGLEFPSKDLFSRAVPSLTQQKHQKQQSATSNKEPNLMPVPSPQQIHYLNTFEGQELTIQKQPNTSLKETNMNSPVSHAPLSETPKCKTPNGAANSPLSQVPETSPRFPSITTSTSTTCTTPVTTQSQPGIPTAKDATTVPSSPDTAGPSPCRSENLPLNPNGISCPPNNKSMHFDPITSLAQMSQQLTSQTTPPCPGAGPMMSYNSSSMHMVGNMNHLEQHVGSVGPGGPMGQMGHENPPLENMQFPPNNPIISCAGPMMDMPPGFLNTSSPKQNMGNPPARCVAPFFGGPGFQKMMGPNTYNGMNVQVKASTPNTIQYLPARPNTNSPNPNTRGPPSLDFLQRFTNPMNNMDSKVSFIPNCHSNSMDGVNPGGNPGMNCGGPVGNSSGNNLMSNSVSNMLLGGNMVLNPGSVGPLRGQLRPGPGGMMKVPQMGGGGGGGGGGPVFSPGPGCDPMVLGPGGNPGGMFIQGSKSSPLGMPPDASQPLPPSMSQGNNFKNSPFVGPTVADPNYAQQFHNFQQQLYATNTRSHQMNSHMNQSYFMPK